MVLRWSGSPNECLVLLICRVVNPLIPNVNEQIFLSCPHNFLIKHWGGVDKISRKFTLGDHILNSHNLRG